MKDLKKYALISMPWMTPDMPSIQLATLKNLLDQQNINSTSFHFYADLAAAIGLNLYRNLDNSSFVLAERLFSAFYFDQLPELVDYDTGERELLGAVSIEAEQDILLFLPPILESFIEDCYAEVDWDGFDVVCFSLTTVQTAASMVLARRIKTSHPQIKIIFGGSSCAGEMGTALSEICDEVDIVVHGEAEVIMPNLISALNSEIDLKTVSGITWKNKKRESIANQGSEVHRKDVRGEPLNFDDYFDRMHKLNLLDKVDPWIPFESSRGCWYGEKSQCTFCGLNEIIEYRSRGLVGLIEELRFYENKYHTSRFFAVDLIMPRAFVKVISPEIEKRGYDWFIFYEVKSNISREKFETLVRGKVGWIQPGIESLDDDTLKLMRKGVSGAQNLQLLIWSKELSVTVNWNLLLGFPGESIESYDRLIELLPLLYHLPPQIVSILYPPMKLFH